MNRHDKTLRTWLPAALLLAAALPAGAGSIEASYLSEDGTELGLIFDEGIGLSGQAVFQLTDARTIDIWLTNTSTQRPPDPWFDDPSDQILTSLYFDLGAPGLNAADPAIIGGWAWVGDDSYSIGKDGSLSGGDEVSTLWGFGNFQYTEPGMDMLPPNLLSTNTAHTTAFQGSETLKGPEYGLATGDTDVFPETTGGLTAIRDTIHVQAWLDRDLATLASLIEPGGFVPHIEFGSDYEFLVQDDFPPPPPSPPAVPEPLTVLACSLGVGSLAVYGRNRLRLA